MTIQVSISFLFPFHLLADADAPKRTNKTISQKKISRVPKINKRSKIKKKDAENTQGIPIKISLGGVFLLPRV